MEVLKSMGRMMIAFEGVECSGKSTLIDAVQKRLDDLGIPNAKVSMVPMGPVRDLLLGTPNLEHSKKERLLLLGLCQMEAKKQIEACFERGQWVLLDRSPLSRIAYQERTDRLYLECKALETITGEFPRIDHLVFLDVPFEESQRRLDERGSLDTIERLGSEYHRQTHQNYQIALEQFVNEQAHLMRCSRPFTEVHALNGMVDTDLNAATLLYAIADSI